MMMMMMMMFDSVCVCNRSQRLVRGGRAEHFSMDQLIVAVSRSLVTSSVLSTAVDYVTSVLWVLCAECHELSSHNIFLCVKINRVNSSQVTRHGLVNTKERNKNSFSEVSKFPTRPHNIFRHILGMLPYVWLCLCL